MPSGASSPTSPSAASPRRASRAATAKLYVNIVDTGKWWEIDGKSLTVTRRWPTAPCQQPVAMDHRHDASPPVQWVCRSGVLAVFRLPGRRVVATAPIGAGVDGTAFDAARATCFAFERGWHVDGLHEDSPDRYHVVQNVQTALVGATWAWIL